MIGTVHHQSFVVIIIIITIIICRADCALNLLRLANAKWNVGVYYRLRAYELNEMTMQAMKLTDDFDAMMQLATSEQKCGELMRDR